MVFRFLCPEDQLADVRGQPVLQRFGGEEPSHVVRGEGQRPAGGGDEAGSCRGVLKPPFDIEPAEGPAFRSGPVLNEQRRRRVPDALERVVGRDQGDRSGLVVPDPGDDDGEDLGELGCDDQHSLDVGLGRRDVQQRDRLAVTGKFVADEAVMRQLGEFLDPDAGMPEYLDEGPCPERVFFFLGQVPAPAGEGVVGP